MKLGVILNRTIEGTDSAVRKLRIAADRLGIEVLDASSAETPDFYLVLGGDGSVLRAVHSVGGSRVPLVNINIGSLGYLTCAGLDELDAVLRHLVDETYIISDRRMLKAEAFNQTGEPLVPPAYALNEAVVSRPDAGRTAGLDLCVDGEDVTAFFCDGLIVATPTGSTAYSLSAGGPIVMPEAHVLIINTICPHTLSSRPLVLPGKSEIVLRVSRAYSPLNFSIDGQLGTTLSVGDTVRISDAKRKVRLVMLPDRSPFETLRRKLNWSGTLLK